VLITFRVNYIHIMLHAELRKFQIGDTLIEIFVPNASEIRKCWEEGWIASPYWAQVWPSAIALSRFILSHPWHIKGRSVVELAAGLGLPSLVAAPIASKVYASDQSPDAVSLLLRSAQHLELQNLEAEVLDWRQYTPIPHAEVLLLSDVNYEPTELAPLTSLMYSFLKKGITILLSTPPRLTARDFLAGFLPYCLEKEEYMIDHGGKEVLVTVFVLSSAKKLP
jgi:predicted nicotinamide N-methyase